MREIDKRRGVNNNNNNNNNVIWSDIRDFIEKIGGGKPRTDVVVRWLSKRDPEYRKTYDGMIQRGELIKERLDAKKTAIRFATPEEHNNNKPRKNIKRALDPVEIIRSMFE